MGPKRNIAQNKGKNSSMNSKLSEDMVILPSLRKTKSKMPSLSTTTATQVSSTDKTWEAFSVTLPTPKWTEKKLKIKSLVPIKIKIPSLSAKSSNWSPKNGSSEEAEKKKLWTCSHCLIEKKEDKLDSMKSKQFSINTWTLISATTTS